MKIITEPTIHLAVRPQVNQESIDRFLADHGVEWTTDATTPGDGIPEVAGRICYMSFAKPRPGGNKAYLDNIKASGHGSVIEHPNWSFIFTGISRSLSHELVRHRAGWGYSQLSQRYVDETDVAFVLPPALKRGYDLVENECMVGVGVRPQEDIDAHALYLAWFASCRYALTCYERMSTLLAKQSPEGLTGTDKRKWARQTARSVLPNSTETKIFATANARAIRHFIEMRASRHAEVEIRKLAIKLLLMMREAAPNLFADYQLEAMPDGTFEATTATRKV